MARTIARAPDAYFAGWPASFAGASSIDAELMQ
jgi:hypothetical protein